MTENNGIQAPCLLGLGRLYNMWMSLRSVLFIGAFFLPISEARGLQTHIYDEFWES